VAIIIMSRSAGNFPGSADQTRFARGWGQRGWDETLSGFS
jgi:hypothetical protein